MQIINPWIMEREFYIPFWLEFPFPSYRPYPIPISDYGFYPWAYIDEWAPHPYFYPNEFFPWEPFNFNNWTATYWGIPYDFPISFDPFGADLIQWEANYGFPKRALQGEMEWLKSQAESIRKQIEQIKSRISEIEKE